MTVNAHGHFSRQASLWEKKFQSSGSMSERPAAFVELLRKNLGGSGSVLDFGCGSADITIACQACGFQMHGVDISEHMISRALNRSDARGIKFRLLESAAQLRLPYAAESFDAEIASSVLEYVHDPLDCLKELSRVSIPGGVLILTVPNLLHPRRWLEVLLRRALFPRHFKSGSAWYLYAEYLKLSKNRLTVNAWSTLLKEAGWELESVHAKSKTLLMLVVKRAQLARKSVDATKASLLVANGRR